MNALLIICVVSGAAALAVLEIVRKVRNWRARASHSAVWVGVDLATGDDICVVHDGTDYRAVDHSSCGTIDEVSA